jgi:hypothetical protein
MTTKMLLITAACAVAATAGEWNAKIPFPFEMNGMAMPAGAYVLRDHTGTPWVQAIHKKTGRTFLFDRMPPSNVALANSQLVFRSVSGNFVLSAITDPATGGQVNLPTSRNVKEAIKTAAITNVTVTAAE